jgi:hypothetical protein
MQQKESIMNNTYRILVKEICDHHFKEWSGYLTLYPQANGDTYLDVSFSDKPVLYAYQDQTVCCNMAELSIEFIEDIPSRM